MSRHRRARRRRLRVTGWRYWQAFAARLGYQRARVLRKGIHFWLWGQEHYWPYGSPGAYNITMTRAFQEGRIVVVKAEPAGPP